MTIAQACRILGVSPDIPKDELKKVYRAMMHRVHPDAIASDLQSGREMPQIHRGAKDLYRDLDAREVNEAYRLLLAFEEPDGESSGRTAGKMMPWNAPENPAAYREREIYQNVEGTDGEIYGRFCVSKGRYYWTPEEEFPLFLYSIYRLSESLLDETEKQWSRKRERGALQAELAYLLAQQFIDSDELLGELAGSEESSVYRVPAMLSFRNGMRRLPEGKALRPVALRKRKLYVGDERGELGYLSFPDDRFYYVIVPLFEQRRVTVRIRAGKAGRSHQEIELLLRMKEELPSMPESLSMQIERMLAGE